MIFGPASGWGLDPRRVWQTLFLILRAALEDGLLMFGLRRDELGAELQDLLHSPLVLDVERLGRSLERNA